MKWFGFCKPQCNSAKVTRSLGPFSVYFSYSPIPKACLMFPISIINSWSLYTIDKTFLHLQWKKARVLRQYIFQVGKLNWDDPTGLKFTHMRSGSGQGCWDNIELILKLISEHLRFSQSFAHVDRLIRPFYWRGKGKSYFVISLRNNLYQSSLIKSIMQRNMCEHWTWKVKVVISFLSFSHRNLVQETLLHLLQHGKPHPSF